jgi:His-Xaa-Ser system radical SAM maturase HxsC
VIELTTYGRPLNLTRPVVARITCIPEPDPSKRSELVLVTETAPEDWDGVSGYRAIITSQSLGRFFGCLPYTAPSIVHSARRVSHLNAGDVVVLYPKTGRIRTLFRPSSAHNALLVTERCNSYCLMCSQPPVGRDDSELIEINLEAIRLMEPHPAVLGITGGEPTLLGEKLFRIMNELALRMPDTEVQMLTNGRRFAWPAFTEAFIDARHPRLTLGVPLYADNAPDHDYVVQARGAFDQTIQGLHRLARYEQPVEIRVVLHKLTIPRLGDLLHFIYRNLPFACHVALMGLEITGFTRPNIEKLWIDPYEYRGELQGAVEFLAIRGMCVSVYNHPLCVLPKSLWKFARRSISDWKNIYLPVCEDCGVRGRCGGFFKSAEIRHSAHLRALPIETAASVTAPENAGGPGAVTALQLAPQRD